MWEGRTTSIAIGIAKAFGGDGKKREDRWEPPPLKRGHKRVNFQGFKDYWQEEIEQQEKENGGRSK